MPRFYCPPPLLAGQVLDLPSGAARHVQVLRMQPGQSIELFDGQGQAFTAQILQMGRSHVRVQIQTPLPATVNDTPAVQLAVCMPANERMDWLVEKATELGVHTIQPLMSERSVLRLMSERASKKVLHWQGIGIAACEQCGANHLPQILPVQPLADWLDRTPAPASTRLILSLSGAVNPLCSAAPANFTTVLCGPEGGFAPAEEARAIRVGFTPASLGPRVLRAETAALAALTLLTLGRH